MALNLACRNDSTRYTLIPVDPQNSEIPATDVNELMWNIGRDQRSILGADLIGLVVYPDQRLALEDENKLFAAMRVQGYRCPGRYVGHAGKQLIAVGTMDEWQACNTVTTIDGAYRSAAQNMPWHRSLPPVLGRPP